MESKECRLCCGNEATTNIFSKQPNEILICDKIKYVCSNISVKHDDGLPSHVCYTCELELTACYQFIQKCETSDKKLRSQAHKLLTQIAPVTEDLKPAKTEIKIEAPSHSDDEQHYEDIPSDDITLEQLRQDLGITIEHLVPCTRKKRPYKKRLKYTAIEASVCSKCGKQCANPSTLLVHMRSHTDERPYSCPSCDKHYKDSGALKRHTERNHLQHHRQRNFTCEHCGKNFYTKHDVKIHMRTHTGETPYSCSECSTRFTQISALLRHKKRHTGEKEHVCPTCSKQFCTKEELKNHLVVHSTDKKFSCTICNAPFKYRNNLKRHVKRHSEPNRFVCNYCGRTFNLKGNLKTHIDKQHSEKSGYCSVCSKSVPNIEIHMWRHTGERPLKCELCTSSFFDSKALARHLNFRHKQTDRFKCQMEACSVAFPSRQMLEYHTVKVHTSLIPFPCDRCTRGFYRKNDLARHKIGTHKEKLI